MRTEFNQTSAKPTLHLLGGFLASGKTTSILAVGAALKAQGVQVGLIANDQGVAQVDASAFTQLGHPNTQIGGACFCCAYEGFYRSLLNMLEQGVEVVLAESVGSCTDLTATVIAPLKRFAAQHVKVASYSVFVDGRLLLQRLLGLPLPVTPEVLYIFDQQLNEAGLLVVTHFDALMPSEKERLRQGVQERYPQQPVHWQDSRDPGQVLAWWKMIQDSTFLPASPLADLSLIHI